MTGQELLTALTGLATASVAAVDKMVKPWLSSILDDAGFAENSKEVVWFLFRFALALVAVFGAGSTLNLLQVNEVYGGIAVVAGNIITAFAVALGAEAISLGFAYLTLRFQVFKAEAQARIYKAESLTNSVKLLKSEKGLLS